MAKRTNKAWTPTDDKSLKALAKGNTPTPLIAYKLDRTVPGVRARAGKLDLSLKPTNKSPYGTAKKK